jgi:hypothetical protein
MDVFKVFMYLLFGAGLGLIFGIYIFKYFVGGTLQHGDELLFFAPLVGPVVGGILGAGYGLTK